MALGGEGCGVVGVECEGDGTARTVLRLSLIRQKTLKTQSMMAVWWSNSITNKF